MTQSNLVGQEITVRCVFVPRFPIPRWRYKRIACYADILKVNSSVMERPEKRNGNLHDANLAVFSSHNFVDGKRLKPCVMK